MQIKNCTCYCSKVTEEQVIEAVINHNAKTVKEVNAVTGAMKNPNCKENNPLGVCCHKNYSEAIDKGSSIEEMIDMFPQAKSIVDMFPPYEHGYIPTTTFSLIAILTSKHHREEEGIQ